MLLITAPLAFLLHCFTVYRVQRALLTLWPQLPRRRLKWLRWLPLGSFLLPAVALAQYSLSGGTRVFLYQEHIGLWDYLLNYPFWIAFLTSAELFPYLLLLTGVPIVWKKFFSSSPPVRRLAAAFQLLLIPTLFIYVSYRILNDTRNVRLREHVLPLRQLPAAFDHFRIALLADIQVDRYTPPERLAPVWEAIRQHPPDLIAFAGDLVTWKNHFVQQGLELLCGMVDSVPRVACMGDHDFWFAPKPIPAGLQSCGWEFLQDQHRIFPWRGNRVLVTGITNIYSRPIPEAQARAILQSAPDAELKILLVHQPSQALIELAGQAGYHLVLAGHTHGGQIVFRPFGFTFTPTQLENRFFSGAYAYGRLWVVVTNGIGLTFAPVRYQAPAEISVIRLQTSESINAGD